MMRFKVWRFAKLGAILCGIMMSTAAWAFPLEVAESPMNSLSLTVSAIRSAQQSLLLNIYELSSPDVADALISRITAGVHVEIIEEGQPVGGVSAAARGIQAQLTQAMRAAGGTDHLFEMTSHASGSGQSIHRRFHYDHAKYAVIDGKNLLIGSENYSPTGNPTAGGKGNRGWEVLIHDGAISAEFAQIFRSDSDLSAGDMMDLTTAPDTTDTSPSDSSSAVLAASSADTSNPQQPTTLEASAVARITSPDSSLSGLLDLLNSATQSIDIQQMTFDSKWGKDGESSPLFQAVIQAARRGVKVRVLLNDERVFNHYGHSTASKNLPTIEALNQAAQDEGLNLAARTADIRRMGVTYIHNKGVLVDGDKTLISSINWDSNAVLNNREAAVVLTSAAVFAHYEALFDSDWNASATKGISIQRTESPMNAPEESVASDACPSGLRVSVKFGTLRSSDPDDRSFDSLSGTHFTGDFVRAPGSHTCLLTDTRQQGRSAKARFIEIRKKSDGTRSLVLEGFTSNSEMYSIRTTLEDEGPFDGDYDAGVYDGSGPAREKLGNALMTLQTRQASLGRETLQ